MRDSAASESATAWQACGETLLVFLVFAVAAGWPVPDPNEPHYLAKAKHYWDRSWVPGDFFLDSADSHLAFYATVGFGSRWLPLPAFAWCGRALTWIALAVAWRRLSTAVVPKFGAAVLSAGLFVALNENLHMAGEWAVGGFEAKGLAYALVFLAYGEVLRCRWNTGWLLLGAASALHVVVGGWATLAAGICWIAAADRPPLARIVPGLLAGGAIALMGVVPALLLTWRVDPQLVAEADQIYVFRRLPHHLSYFDLPRSFRMRFACLVAAWCVLCALLPRPAAAERRLSWLVWGAILFAVLGTAISAVARAQPAAAAGWLRFYWFRLSDVLVPLGAAISATQVAFLAWRVRPARGRFLAAVLAATTVVLLWPNLAARLQGGPPRADKPGKVANYADWRAACEWVGKNTPADARFITPRSAQTFKWYAGRGEVVTWKDLPQDAAAIVEWWRRLRDLHGTGDEADPWRDSLNELSPARLRELGAQYQAGYLLTEADPPLELPSLYRNNSYAVYALSP